MRTAAIVAGLGILLLGSVFVWQYFQPDDDLRLIQNRIHYYRNPSVGLNNIQLEVVFASSLGTSSPVGLDIALDSALRKIAHFHSVQFLGQSQISYRIDRPVLISNGQKANSLFTESPELSDELQKMMEPLENEQAYRIRVYVVDGNGMGFLPGMAYLPAELFLASEYSSLTEALLYHLLGRAMGLPAGTDGIMGLGRMRPIESNFIEPELLRNMGLLN